MPKSTSTQHAPSDPFGYTLSVEPFKTSPDHWPQSHLFDNTNSIKPTCLCGGFTEILSSGFKPQPRLCLDGLNQTTNQALTHLQQEVHQGRVLLVHQRLVHLERGRLPRLLLFFDNGRVALTGAGQPGRPHEALQLVLAAAVANLLTAAGVERGEDG